MIEKIAANKAENKPTIIPILNCVSKWKMSRMPNKLKEPISISLNWILACFQSGSINELNKLVHEKHTKAIDTLASLILW